MYDVFYKLRHLNFGQLPRLCQCCFGTWWCWCYRAAFAYCESILACGELNGSKFYACNMYQLLWLNCYDVIMQILLMINCFADLSSWFNWHAAVCNNGFWLSCCNGHLWVKIQRGPFCKLAFYICILLYSILGIMGWYEAINDLDPLFVEKSWSCISYGIDLLV